MKGKSAGQSGTEKGKTSSCVLSQSLESVGSCRCIRVSLSTERQIHCRDLAAQLGIYSNLGGIFVKVVMSMLIWTNRWMDRQTGSWQVAKNIKPLTARLHECRCVFVCNTAASSLPLSSLSCPLEARYGCPHFFVLVRTFILSKLDKSK